jgi:hypothetical protein
VSKFERNLNVLGRPALFLLIALTVGIREEPWIGILLLALALSGILSAFIIRALNRP